MPFTYDRVSLCILIVRGIWTFCLLLNRELLYQWAITTYCDVLTQLLHTLLEYTIQHTTYLLSCELLSSLLRPMCYITVTHQPLKLHTSPWLQHLEPIHYPFSYQLTSWFCSEVSTTCYFPHTLVPLRASRYAFFPLHLLHCYNHRSYQWSDPHRSEQACLIELLPAELRRLTSFGSITRLILCNAGRTIRYRTSSCPWILNIAKHTVCMLCNVKYFYLPV